MTGFPPFILVVAALIRDEAGRLLLQQVPPGKRHSGLWELPGGKVEARETPRGALAREIAEELGIALDPAAAAIPCGFADEAAEEERPELVLLLYNCPAWEGEPQALEGQAWGWFTPDEAAALPMGAMDRALLAGALKQGPA